MSAVTSERHDRLIGTAKVLLDVCREVTGSALRAAVRNFR